MGVSEEKCVYGQGDPDGGSEEDEKPLEHVSLPKNVFETVLATPHCADRIDDEVDG